MFEPGQVEALARFLADVDRPDLFAYYGGTAEDPVDRRARLVADRRRWAQGNQSNPKYRDEALFLIRHHPLLQRVLVEDCPRYAEHVRVTRREQQSRMLDSFVSTVLASGPLGAGGDTAIRHFAGGLGLEDEVTERIGTGRAAPPRAAPVAPSPPSLAAAESAHAVAAAPPTLAPEAHPLASPPIGLLPRVWLWFWSRLFGAEARTGTRASSGPRRREADPRGHVPRGTYPWDGVECVPKLGLDAARVRALERLYPLLDRAAEPGDAAFLERLIRNCSEAELQFPLFPDSALKLDALLRDEDSETADVAELIRHDPALVQRVWEQACSAVYGSKPPANLDAAIVRIGRRALWRIGMRACVNAPVFHVYGWQKQANEIRNIGIVAGEVSERLYPDVEPYLPALLHGVGRLIAYRAAVARPGTPEPSRALVLDVARSLQAALGVIVSGTWQLGVGVSAGIGFAPAPDRAPPAWVPIARATSLGLIAAHVVGSARRRAPIDATATFAAMGVSPERAAHALVFAEEAWSQLPPDSA